MKQKLTVLIILFLSMSLKIFAQDGYWSSAGYMILSFSNASYQDPTDASKRIDIADAPRFTIWLNSNFFYNYDFSKKFGIYSGFGVNNIGLITKEAASVTSAVEPDFGKDVKWKRRAYTLSIPLALKIGNLDNFYFFGGGQYDYLFHYKEKEFLSTGKRKMTEWFSQRINNFIPSVFAGLAFKGGVSIQFSYALDNFMNPDFSYTNNGITIRPYENMESRLYSFTLFVNSVFSNITENTKEERIIAIL
jgi:hypothetical protein